MCNCCYLEIYDPTNNLFFNIHIKNKEVAQSYCDFLSKRDSRRYEIRMIHMLIGTPEYKDREIMEAISNV